MRGMPENLKSVWTLSLRPWRSPVGCRLPDFSLDMSSFVLFDADGVTEGARCAGIAGKLNVHSRSMIDNAVSNQRRLLEPEKCRTGVWGKLSVSRISWWKTPTLASMRYVLILASFVAILIGVASRRQILLCVRLVSPEFLRI